MEFKLKDPKIHSEIWKQIHYWGLSDIPIISNNTFLCAITTTPEDLFYLYLKDIHILQTNRVREHLYSTSMFRHAIFKNHLFMPNMNSKQACNFFYTRINQEINTQLS